MKNSINKYLFIIGIAIAGIFAVYILIDGLFEKTKYTLIVYNKEIHNQVPIVDGLKDTNHRINAYSNGFPGLYKRINVISTPLYVLVKQKNQEIEFVTDKIDILNDFLKNEIK